MLIVMRQTRILIVNSVELNYSILTKLILPVLYVLFTGLTLRIICKKYINDEVPTNIFICLVRIGLANTKHVDLIILLE